MPPPRMRRGGVIALSLFEVVRLRVKLTTPLRFGDRDSKGEKGNVLGHLPETLQGGYMLTTMANGASRKMNDIIPFMSPEGKSLRSFLDEEGNPWFVAKDVCDALGHSNSRVAIERLDDDEKGVTEVYTPGGRQAMSIVNEFGFYSLVLRSSLPNAKAFKRWVTHDVLPQVRKTGSYSIKKPTELELAKQLVAVLEEKERLENDLGPQGDGYRTLAQIFNDLDLHLPLGALAYLGRLMVEYHQDLGLPIGRALMASNEPERRPATRLYSVDAVLQFLADHPEWIDRCDHLDEEA